MYSPSVIFTRSMRPFFFYHSIECWLVGALYATIEHALFKFAAERFHVIFCPQEMWTSCLALTNYILIQPP